MKKLIIKNGMEWIIDAEHLKIMDIMNKKICKYYLPTCGECGNYKKKYVGRYCIGPKCEDKKPLKK